MVSPWYANVRFPPIPVIRRLALVTTQSGHSARDRSAPSSRLRLAFAKVRKLCARRICYRLCTAGEADIRPKISKIATTSAHIAVAGTIFFFLVMYVAFPFIQPELNPLYRFGSEYAVGRLGWLMKLAFFVWGGGLLAFAIAMATGLDSGGRSRVAVVLFAIGAAGIFLSGVFDADLQVLNDSPPPRWVQPPPSEEQVGHAAAGSVGLISLVGGAGSATRRLRRAERLRGVYRWLRPLAWAVSVAFVVSIVLIEVGLTGLGQRIFLLLLFIWLLIAARGVETGALLPRR